MFVRSLFILRAVLLAALSFLLPSSVFAHGAFDHNVRMWVYENHLELTVTMGPELARIFLDQGPEAVLHSGKMETPFPFPPVSAERILQLHAAGLPLAPTQTTVRSDGLEFVFSYTFPRPKSGPLTLTPHYPSQAPPLPRSSILIVDENEHILAAKILATGSGPLQFDLPAKNSTPSVPAPPKAKEELRMNNAETPAQPATPPRQPSRSPFKRRHTLLLTLIATTCAILGTRYLKKSAPRKP